jgi:hypothetical protein
LEINWRMPTQRHVLNASVASTLTDKAIDVIRNPRK